MNDACRTSTVDDEKPPPPPTPPEPAEVQHLTATARRKPRRTAATETDPRLKTPTASSPRSAQRVRAVVAESISAVVGNPKAAVFVSACSTTHHRLADGVAEFSDETTASPPPAALTVAPPAGPPSSAAPDDRGGIEP